SPNLSATSKAAAYQQTVAEIKEVVEKWVAQDATLLVVSRGDPQLLDFRGRKAWHFPRGRAGAYAGYHPADSAGAITHLESLIADGGQYLLFPSTAFWWLEYYGEFKEYLYQYPPRIVHDQRCVLFHLSPNT